MWGVSVSEANPHVCEALHISCEQLHVVIIAAPVLIDGGVTQSHIIGKIHDDIGLWGAVNQVAGAEEKKDGKDASHSKTRVFVWFGLTRKCCRSRSLIVTSIVIGAEIKRDLELIESGLCN